MFLVILVIGAVSVAHQIYYVGEELKAILKVQIFSIKPKSN